MEVIFYASPNGRQKTLEINGVYPEDEKWFVDNGIVVSMETLPTGVFAIYGRYPEHGEDDELIVLDEGRTCKECLQVLRQELEAFAKEKTP